MTQVVFVHGVATREGDHYDRSVANRNALMAEVLFAGQPASFHAPLWGNHVPEIEEDVFATGKVAQSFSLGLAGSPGGVGLGLGDSPGLSAGASGQRQESGPLSCAGLSRTDPVAALDAVFVELLERYEEWNEAIPTGDLAMFQSVADAIAIDIDAGDSQRPADGAAALLAAVHSDREFAKVLNAGTDDAASYGIGNRLREAIEHVTDRIRNVASRVAVDPLVDLVRPAVGFFLGDVFAYLHVSETREAIRAEVRNSLVQAHAERATGEKLVVFGHSLGGVILLDMLSNPAEAGLPDGFAVDALFTVGSQPGLFQALGLIVDASADRVPSPANVAHWYNVFDPIDPLAFRCDPIFEGVTDLKFNSITGVASAHTTYFKRPQFYARARKRLRDIRVIV